MPPAAMRTSTSLGPSAGTSVSSSLRSRDPWMTTASDMAASPCAGLKAHRAAPQPALLRAYLPVIPEAAARGHPGPTAPARGHGSRLSAPLRPGRPALGARQFGGRLV